MGVPHARHRAAFITAVLAGASLVLPVGQSPAHAVGGAAATNSALAFNVRLTVGDLTRACSGALLNQWWVLTAASCFADGSGTPVVSGAPKLATTATIGRLDLAGTSGYVRSIRTIVAHPDRDLV